MSEFQSPAKRLRVASAAVHDDNMAARYVHVEVDLTADDGDVEEADVGGALAPAASSTRPPAVASSSTPRSSAPDLLAQLAAERRAREAARRASGTGGAHYAAGAGAGAASGAEPGAASRTIASGLPSSSFSSSASSSASASALTALAALRTEAASSENAQSCALSIGDEIVYDAASRGGASTDRSPAIVTGFVNDLIPVDGDTVSVILDGGSSDGQLVPRNAVFKRQFAVGDVIKRVNNTGGDEYGAVTGFVIEQTVNSQRLAYVVQVLDPAAGEPAPGAARTRYTGTAHWPQTALNNLRLHDSAPVSSGTITARDALSIQAPVHAIVRLVNANNQSIFRVLKHIRARYCLLEQVQSDLGQAVSPTEPARIIVEPAVNVTRTRIEALLRRQLARRSGGLFVCDPASRESRAARTLKVFVDPSIASDLEAHVKLPYEMMIDIPFAGAEYVVGSEDVFLEYWRHVELVAVRPGDTTLITYASARSAAADNEPGIHMSQALYDLLGAPVNVFCRRVILAPPSRIHFQVEGGGKPAITPEALSHALWKHALLVEQQTVVRAADVHGVEHSLRIAYMQPHMATSKPANAASSVDVTYVFENIDDDDDDDL